MKNCWSGAKAMKNSGLEVIAKSAMRAKCMTGKEIAVLAKRSRILKRSTGAKRLRKVKGHRQKLKAAKSDDEFLRRGSCEEVKD